MNGGNEWGCGRTGARLKAQPPPNMRIPTRDFGGRSRRRAVVADRRLVGADWVGKRALPASRRMVHPMRALVSNDYALGTEPRSVTVSDRPGLTVSHRIQAGWRAEQLLCSVLAAPLAPGVSEAISGSEQSGGDPMGEQDKLQRTVLPIPDQPHVGLTTYDAKDPDTKYPPIRQLRPPPGAPNVLIVLIDDVGYGASSAFGGPCHTPNFEKLGANGLRFTRFHTTALCSPTRQAMLTGRNHHTVGMGGITEIATSAPGLQLDPAEHLRAARAHPQAQRLFDRAVRQVPRSAGLADEPDGSVRRVAQRRRRVRVFLRVHRRRDEPVLSGALRRHDADRAGEDARTGLSPDRRPDHQGDQLDPPAKGVDARQAVLHLFRAGRDPRAASCAEGMGGQVQGQVRPGLGQAARGDLRPAEDARRHPRGLRADAAPRRDPRLGRDRPPK